MLMRHSHPELQFMHALPYGAVIHDNGVQFVVFSRSATAMRLLIYEDVDDREPSEVITLNPRTDRWGDIWSVFVPQIGAGTLYHFQADGPYCPERGQWFNGKARLIDPYAKALAGNFQRSTDGVIRPPKCVVVDDYFDWDGDRHLRHEMSESVIYEMHVRGYTRGAGGEVEYPGSYLGVIEKIPYLKSLGVTAVELMPVHEFPTRGIYGDKLDRPNYWGYDPLAFFAPHSGYAVSAVPGYQVVEFKQMVRALHQAGIEVILDVVFNHTCEGNHLGPTLSFRGLENQVYYMLENGGGRYKNYSGCGNTINGNHPIVREMIFHCLRHWVHNYHVDGFRFDLASILSRDREGNLVPNPPLLEAIAEDPLLSDTKIIAEAWDAAGAFQVGSFGDRRWAEWNGHYRDDVRKFWRGDPGTLGSFVTRLSGSSDLYEKAGRPPHCSINFITSHDGFTLNDLVSYRWKHNEANGEGNSDGDNNNHSDNYGVEGPTEDALVDELRLRQMKNMLATLMFSQGVPMIVFGDECRRTQQGNNNAYCQDNEMSWFDWKKVESNADLVRFTSALIQFRRNQPTVRRRQFFTGRPTEEGGLPDVSWYGPLGTTPNWHGDLTLISLMKAPQSGDETGERARDVLLLFNATGEPREFVLPPVAKEIRWRLFVDTAADAPLDIYPELDGPPMPESGRLMLPYRAMACYVSE
ncbi:MAG TPA: glycogen debranching protein GlgX [Pirellulaceae bacterium]|nr:glycogen debranching protein GlgX [Pirellulaceae bacterium]